LENYFSAGGPHERDFQRTNITLQKNAWGVNRTKTQSTKPKTNSKIKIKNPNHILDFKLILGFAL